MQDVEQIAGRARQPIEPHDHERVALIECRQRLAQHRAIRMRARRMLDRVGGWCLGLAEHCSILLLQIKVETFGELAVEIGQLVLVGDPILCGHNCLALVRG